MSTKQSLPQTPENPPQIQFNEAHLGPYARPEDAWAAIAELRAAGWPVVYTADRHGCRWDFATRREYSQFERELERMADRRRASISIGWACECEDAAECTCGQQEDVRAQTHDAADDSTMQALMELYGYELEAIVDTFYPGLRDWIELNIGSLYGAVAYGIRWAKATGAGSATELFLKRTWKAEPNRKETYDQGLEEFARFVMFAADDAAMSEVLARAHLSLDDLQRCETCGDWLLPGCSCDWREEEDLS